MQILSIGDVVEYVEGTISTFHTKRIEKIGTLKW
jgi:hypothetical protein